MSAHTLADENRFFSRLKKSGECWEWQGYVRRDGYGEFHLNGRRMPAHRFALLITGRNPGNLMALHKCDNRRCVRPSHLFVGTQLDNMRDKWAKGRGRVAFGESHVQAKLTERAVREIRSIRRWPHGAQIRVARRFGINKSTLRSVRLGKTWKHVSVGRAIIVEPGR